MNIVSTREQKTHTDVRGRVFNENSSDDYFLFYRNKKWGITSDVCEQTVSVFIDNNLKRHLFAKTRGQNGLFWTAGLSGKKNIFRIEIVS